MAEQVGKYVTAKLASAIQSQPDVSHNGGRVRAVVDSMTAVDAAQNDTIHLATLPSNAVLLPSSTIYHDDFGTGVTLDIGTFDVNGSNADDDDSISADADVATAAGSFAVMDSVVTRAGMRLWELAGAASDPGGDIKIKATIKDGNPGSAGMAWQLHYTID